MAAQLKYLESLFSLAGKTALITGGSSGIGREMAFALGQAGARVVLVARRPLQLYACVADLATLGVNAFAISADIKDVDSLDGIVAKVTADHGVPDILVNAAGINRRPHMDQLTLEDWHDTLAANLTAPFVLGQGFGPRMAERGSGRIINMVSQQGFRAFGNSGAYGASKGGLVALTRSQAEAWSPRGVLCNAVAPGVVRTPLTEMVFRDPVKAEVHAARTMIKRNGLPQDFAGVAVYLASDASAAVTGQTIFVDGGHQSNVGVELHLMMLFAVSCLELPWPSRFPSPTVDPAASIFNLWKSDSFARHHITALPSIIAIMILRSTIATGAFAALAQAAQPGAVEPVDAPMRDLTWGQLNFLHTTDTHGWLGGHFQEPQYSADWGDYISFSHHMRQQAEDKGADLLLVDTGDRIEGNGLYDSSSPKGLFQYGIYAEQDVDIICTGNHELYKAYSADREHTTTVPNYKNNYIASNLDYIDFETGDRIPMAKRYRKFKTKKQGVEIVAFGFIFDFTGNANNTVVQPVEETIKEEWFQEAIREKPDLFVVIGHVGLRMEEFKVIFTALRKQNWYIPIAFFGGHAHVRDALKYDSKAFAMASGRYFETIGWMSIDGIKKHKDDVSAETSPSFTRKYIDNNLCGMYHHTGLNESTFPTKHGKRVSDTISRARKALDLDYKFGCAPKNLWMTRAEHTSDDSIYTWLTEEVLPDVVTNKHRKEKSRLTILNTGAIRFDIFKGAFTRDSTFAVSPFTSGFRYVPDVPYAAAQKVIGLLNSGGKIFQEDGIDTRFMAIPEQMFPMPVYPTAEADEPRLELRDVQEPLGDSKLKPDPIPGYTTKDDIGTDGDDTVHRPLKFYNQPNCIQSEIAFPKDGEPETVDLIFLDFIQPWIMVALKFSGVDYEDGDVEEYMEGSFTFHMAQWIAENWKGDC
ncbi:hypothetical protein G7046_g7316 [Stylonectria norvegica]|nr:hypothetical protein G7046_g7316 [Stylonectria norvegica]